MEVDREIVNQAFLDEITDGDSELLAELVALFIKDLPQYEQLLFQALKGKDRLTFNQITHKFRSSLNSLAMLGVAEKLKILEIGDQPFDFNLGVQLADLFQDINRGVSILENQLKRDITN